MFTFKPIHILPFSYTAEKHFPSKDKPKVWALELDLCMRPIQTHMALAEFVP